MSRFIEKSLNIEHHEVGRTIFAWSVKFLHTSGFIVGWTIITTLFISKFSIRALPILFLIQAGLNICGMVFFGLFSSRLSLKSLLLGCAFSAGILIMMAGLLIQNVPVFFGIIFLTTGILIPQLSIALGSYLEKLFSPLEAERITSVVESAETIGGIFAGLLITGLNFLISPNKFFFVWTFLLFLMLSVIIFLKPKEAYNQHIHPEHKPIPATFRKKFSNFKNSLNEIQKIPFLQILFCLFLFHWIIAHLLEYQYTSIVEAGVHGSETAKYENDLSSGLASFEILFNSCALIVQLFIAGRIIKKLGTTSSFLIHGIMTFLSACAMFLGFGSFTVILAKNNFEISGIIQKSGYEGSYYALKHGTQHIAREFFEALLAPLTILILVFQWFFLEKHVNFSIQMLFFSFTALMLALSFRLQRRYTNLAKKNLLEGNNSLSKFHAIEILSQKGHYKGAEILLKALHQKNPVEVKIKILESVGKIGDPIIIPDLLEYLQNPERRLVLAAVLALESFPNLELQIFNQAFSRYRIIHDLKKLFLKTDEEIQAAIIKTLAHFRDQEIVSFLLEIIKTGSPSVQATGIKVCGLFHDLSAAHFLEPYLKNKNYFVKAQTISSLWQFRKFHPRLKKLLKAMLTSANREEILAGCSIIGDLGKHEDKKTLIPFLTVIDPELRWYASFALLKLGYNEAAPYLAHLLLSKNSVVLKRPKELLQELRFEQKELIKNLLQKEASRKVHHSFQDNKNMYQILNQIDHELLERLKNAYLSLGFYPDAQSIDQILDRCSSNNGAGEVTVQALENIPAF